MDELLKLLTAADHEWKVTIAASMLPGSYKAFLVRVDDGDYHAQMVYRAEDLRHGLTAEYIGEELRRALLGIQGNG